MNCKICTSETNEVFEKRVLFTYGVKYFFCTKCEFMQTEEPYWLEQAYNNPINNSDTGIISRNISFRNSISPILLLYFGRAGTFLDYAGGYGILTRMMRDEGFNFFTIDPFTENVLAKGFNYTSKSKITLITALECFEHFVNPLEELDRMLSISRNIFFTTKLLPDPMPKPEQWFYYGFNHGQHTSLYRKKTLIYIAKKHNLNFYTVGESYHLFTERKLNSFVFAFLVIMGRLGLLRWLKVFLKSRSRSDHEFLINKMTVIS
jgi:hypothetical protein